VTSTELVIYAAEMKLLLVGLAALAAIFFAAALLFAFFFGTVNPRLRRADHRCRHLKAENETLRAGNRDSSLAETKALLERLQTVTAHVDMP
jgi:hypothetical protein